MKPHLLLTLDFPPARGGVARYYDGLARALDGRLGVLAPPHPLAPAFDARVPYPLFREPLLRGVWPRWLLAILDVVAVRRQFHFDALLVGNILPLGYPALIMKWFGVPYSIVVHGLDILMARRSGWKLFWARVIARNAASIIANSEATATLARQVFGENCPVCVVYPCPSLPSAAPDEIKRFKERWDTQGKKIILSVSRLVARKGHDIALQAIGAVVRAVPNSHYLIVGDGPDRDRLEQLATSLGVDRHVTFTGALPDEDVAAALGAADVFVLPTRSDTHDVEGFGLVFLEAAAAGVPVVAGEGGGVGESVVNNVTGLVVDPEDPQAIGEALVRLLADTELHARFAAAGRERVRTIFRWEEQIKHLCLP